jgi:hypothetical protein
MVAMTTHEPDDELEHERLAEPWVQSLQASWATTRSSEELAEATMFDADPIDRYLYDGWAQLRRLAGAISLRLASNWPVDDQLLGAAGRRAATEAVRHIGDVRQLLEEAIGTERVLAFEEQMLEELGRPGERDAADDDDT